MKSFKICFSYWHTRCIIYHNLIPYLKNNLEFDYCYFSIGKNWLKRTIKEEYPGFAERYIFWEWFYDKRYKDISDVKIKEKVKYYESKYGIPFLHYFMVSDRMLYGKIPYEDYLKIVVGMFDFFEYIIDKEKPDILISGAVAEVFDMIMFYVANKYNVPVMCITPARIPGKIHIIYNPYDNFELLKKNYEEIKKRDLSSEEREKSKIFINKLTKGQLIPSYMSNKNFERFHFNISGIRMFWRQVIDYYFLDNKNLYLYSPFQKLCQELTKTKNKFALKLKNFYDRPNIKNESYVFYPLHFQPEASTLVLAPHFLNQVEVIRNISISIPSYMRVYVKEHKAMINRRSLSFYKEIKQLPNVKILSPYEDTFELIRNSELIIVITSTVGFESIFFKKPVIVLGNTFYQIFEGVYKETDYTKLPAAVHKAIRNHQDNEELIYKFAYAYLNSVYNGVHDDPVLNPYVISKENMRDLAAAIFSEIRRIGIGK